MASKKSSPKQHFEGLWYISFWQNQKLKRSLSRSDKNQYSFVFHVPRWSLPYFKIGVLINTFLVMTKKREHEITKANQIEWEAFSMLD